MRAKITADHLERTALVYVRQSMPDQVRDHTESRRRQYGLVDVARELGFRRVETIMTIWASPAEASPSGRGFNVCSRPSARERLSPCWRSKPRSWRATIATATGRSCGGTCAADPRSGCQAHRAGEPL
jgi:hypothetical protein